MRQYKSSYQSYSKYEKTGIEWLREVPEHWELEKLKFYVQLNKSGVEVDKDTEIQKIALENIESETGKLSFNEDDKSFEGKGNAFAPGDVLFNKLRPYLAKVICADFHGLTVGELLVLTPNSGQLKSRFLFYRMLSEQFIKIVNNSTYGVKMPRASWDFIGNLKIGIPPLPEQKAIASFLDHQTTRIDQLIEKKKRLLELLDEQRQAIITTAVTKGINPDVPMKDSGIDWLGEVPEHWDAAKVKRVGSIKYGLGEPPEKMDGGLPFIRATDIFRGIINSEKIQHINPDAVPWSRNPELKAKDILVVRSGAYTGDSAIVPPEFEGAIAGYDMVFTCNQVIPEFIANAFLSRYILEAQFHVARSRAAQPHLNAEELGNCTLLLPPLPEQKKIINFLSHKKVQIDQLKNKIQTAINRLEE